MEARLLQERRQAAARRQQQMGVPVSFGGNIKFIGFKSILVALLSVSRPIHGVIFLVSKMFNFVQCVAAQLLLAKLSLDYS